MTAEQTTNSKEMTKDEALAYYRLRGLKPLSPIKETLLRAGFITSLVVTGAGVVDYSKTMNDSGEALRKTESALKYSGHSSTEITHAQEIFSKEQFAIEQDLVDYSLADVNSRTSSENVLLYQSARVLREQKLFDETSIAEWKKTEGYKRMPFQIFALAGGPIVALVAGIQLFLNRSIKKLYKLTETKTE